MCTTSTSAMFKPFQRFRNKLHFEPGRKKNIRITFWRNVLVLFVPNTRFSSRWHSIGLCVLLSYNHDYVFAHCIRRPGNMCMCSACTSISPLSLQPSVNLNTECASVVTDGVAVLRTSSNLWTSCFECLRRDHEESAFGGLIVLSAWRFPWWDNSRGNCFHYQKTKVFKAGISQLSTVLRLTLSKAWHMPIYVFSNGVWYLMNKSTCVSKCTFPSYWFVSPSLCFLSFPFLSLNVGVLSCSYQSACPAAHDHS